MIMPVLEYTEMEVGRVRNIYNGFMVEESIGGNRTVGFGIRGMGNKWRVRREGLEDVTMELFLVHDYCCTENKIC